jgi:hypothetical protein
VHVAFALVVLEAAAARGQRAAFLCLRELFFYCMEGCMRAV